MQVKAFGGKLVADVGCGHNFTVCVTSSGDVYAFGSNDEGALGVGEDDDIDASALPLRVALPALPAPAPSGIPMSPSTAATVSAVSCGSFHVVAQTECGRVLAWGNNEYGQLGLGDEDPRFAPVLVELTSRVVQVCLHANVSSCMLLWADTEFNPTCAPCLVLTDHVFVHLF